MNIYTHQFFAKCPNNGKQIAYDVTITVPSSRKIFVEHIITCASLCAEGFHEDIANMFFDQFGGRQVIKAHHHGVDIETRRGFDEEGCLPERLIMGKLVFEKGVEFSTVVDSLRNQIKIA